MSKLTPELQKQIEQEAEQYESATQHEGLGPAIYVDGAIAYAEKWQAAEARAGRYEKALRQLREHILRCHKVLTNPNGLVMLPIIDEALTPKTTNDDTVNG